MKKIPALILVFVFAFTTVASPVLAWHPDDIRYNGKGTEPEGDDGGWGVPNLSPSVTSDTTLEQVIGSTSSRTTIRMWIGCLLLHFGVYSLEISKPSEHDLNDDNTDTRNTTESGTPARE